MKIVGRKVADTRGKINKFFQELRGNTFDSCASNRHNAAQTLVALGSSLRVLIDHGAKGLQQSTHAALLNAAGDVRETFGDAPGVVDKKLSVKVGHAKHNESARPRSFTAHMANCESRRGWVRARSNSRREPKDGTPRSPTTASPGAMDPRAHLGRS